MFEIAVATSSVNSPSATRFPPVSARRSERRGVQRAPEPSVDDDRSADRGTDAELSRGRRRWRPWPSRIVDAGGPPGPKHLRDDVLSLEDNGVPTGSAVRARPSSATTVASRRPRSGRFSCPRRRGPGHLLGDRGEDLRRRLARDQRRHAPQRGLLLREPSHLGPRLAFEIAVATSSAKLASRASVPAGSGSSALRGGEHHAPRPLVDRRSGRPTAERIPTSRMDSTCGPAAWS